MKKRITTLVNNNDGTFTYISEDGTSTTYDETTTSIAIDNVTNDITYVDEDGNSTVMNLCTAVDNCETVTSLTFNTTTNQIEYVDENNFTNIIDLGDLVSVVTDDNAATNVKVIATHTSGDGTVEEIEETVTEMSFNATNNNIEYTDENEVVNSIDLGDLVSEVSDDNANTNVQVIATHTSGDGTVEEIEESVTSLVR